MERDDSIYKSVKFTIMFLMGLVILIDPNSLLTIVLFVTGLYFVLVGINALVSSVALMKYSKGWVYDGVKFIILTVIGALITFNAGGFATTISGVVFVILGLSITTVGVVAISRSREHSGGIVLIVIGLLIIIFPLGVSFFITRILGLSLMGLAVYLLMILKTRSS